MAPITQLVIYIPENPSDQKIKYQRIPVNSLTQFCSMAISPSSLKLTTSGFLHLQNPFHHLPSTSQTTLTFSTKKILGPNPMAALTLTRAPTNIPTTGISQTFTKLKSQGKVAFIPYITAGDPDLSTTAAALKVLDSCGSDIIELGLPYSDPLLDGPVIRDSATRSLARGTNFNKIISMLKEVVPQLSCPIVLFTYGNPVIKHGIEDFMFTISQAGVRGLVVPDIPFENTPSSLVISIKGLLILSSVFFCVMY